VPRRRHFVDGDPAVEAPETQHEITGACSGRSTTLTLFFFFAAIDIGPSLDDFIPSMRGIDGFNGVPHAGCTKPHRQRTEGDVGLTRFGTQVGL
jgi:hypothetical protein